MINYDINGLKKETGLTTKAFAEKVGIAVSLVYNSVTKGKISDRTLNKLRGAFGKIVEAFEIVEI